MKGFAVTFTLTMVLSAIPLTAQPNDLPYRDPRRPVEERVADLLGRMSLADKLGQMVMGGRDWVTPAQVETQRLGSLLSGGDSPPPAPNNLAGWTAMIQGYQAAALSTPLGIPLLYGIDAVHGFGALPGATLFPHQVGLAAADNPDLMRRIGQATAQELAAVGIYWNFAPMVAVVDDIRWGRAFESLGADTARVSRLAAAYTGGFQQGLEALDQNRGRERERERERERGQDQDPNRGQDLPRPLATAKHYLGDGGVVFGSSHFQIRGVWSRLDRGDTQGEESVLLARHLPPYQAQVAAGVGAVMISYSSWNGVRMHGHSDLLQGVLRRQMGFTGLVVSDWEALQFLPATGFDQQVAMAVNAGVDVLMEPARTAEVLGILQALASSGQIAPARIDEAVARVLRLKFAMGLFEHPGAVAAAGPRVGSADHRALAREAVRKSQVLLKNQGALPLWRGQRLLVAGSHADDLGLQSGGWTLVWSGFQGDNQRLPGATTLLTGLREVGGDSTLIDYSPTGDFAGPRATADADSKAVAKADDKDEVQADAKADADIDGKGDQKADLKFEAKADAAIVVVGEPPYSEWLGDRDAEGLRLTAEDQALIARVRPQARKLILVLVTGRPMILDQALDASDAIVVAWLPGSEGAGVADTLFGEAPFTGRLPFAWPRDVSGIGPAPNLSPATEARLLFPEGFGLSD